MYQIIKNRRDSPSYPLDYENSETTKSFDKLREALAYWKRNRLRGSEGYFLVVVEGSVRPTALRLEKEHFL